MLCCRPGQDVMKVPCVALNECVAGRQAVAGSDGLPTVFGVLENPTDRRP